MKVKYTHAQSQGLWWVWPWNTRNLGLVSRAQWMHAFSSLSESSFNIDSFKSMFSDMDSSRKEGRQLQKFLPGDSSFGNEMSCFQRVYLSEQSTSSKRNQFSKLAGCASGHKETSGVAGNVLFLDYGCGYMGLHVYTFVKTLNHIIKLDTFYCMLN